MKVIFGVVMNIVLNNIKCLPFTTPILSFFVRCKNGSKSMYVLNLDSSLY